MWQPKQPGVGMKPEPSGQSRKRKHLDQSETETESEGLGPSPSRNCQDGTQMVFQKPGKARKKICQEHQDQKLKKEQPGKGQGQKTQEEGSGNIEPLVCLPDQAVVEKSAEGGKCRKRPYSVLQEKPQSPLNEKYARSLEQLQGGHPVRSDPHRPHPTFSDTSNNKGGMPGHPHGSETAQGDRQSSTEVLSTKREKRGAEEKCVRGNSLEHGLPGTENENILDSGGGRLLPNKVAVVAGEKKALPEQENNQEKEFTKEMEKEVEKALGPGTQEEILSTGFKLKITRGDMQTLKNGQWLNDEVINFYMNLLVQRNENQGYPALHAFSTFFYPKLKHGGYNSVKRWTRGINLFEKELILVPIHQRVHWSLVVIDLRKRSIVYLDSMGQTGENICETIFHYLQNESKTRRDIELDPVEWKQYSLTSQEIPQQLNGSDCGMFTCKYADYISRDQPVTFSQQHMPLFRKRMVWEILHSHLL
ncbi:sentrin-specific protease 2-like [Rattus rattus]|uniref:sentrin-specific protease 2-like n=1 Tax=Rattus rattus TaxID=10117 RepID=UPI0013F35A99|nr:sentrin-specific protease 2-like [Rattus rattus]